MDMSSETNKIFPAFVKMQAALGNAAKDKQGHGYNYADLSMCIGAAKQPLADNGLAVSQMIGQSEHGTTLITMLMHESGQHFRSEFVMERASLMGGAGKNPAQVMGSSITYMRRYAYTAILGMTQADDDGAMVGFDNQQQRPAARQPAPAQVEERAINPQEYKALQGALMVAGMDEKEFCHKFAITNIGQLPISKLEGSLKRLKQMANEQAAWQDHPLSKLNGLQS
ncbi:ERF family protein [Endozoicomonas sp. Mp262]|uniref:ERF family protein n=1 Tax=Endozoicomonas sp. Mp262 TaxID=2919499 RepID=UPI0021D897EE